MSMLKDFKCLIKSREGHLLPDLMFITSLMRPAMESAPESRRESPTTRSSSSLNSLLCMMASTRFLLSISFTSASMSTGRMFFCSCNRPEWSLIEVLLGRQSKHHWHGKQWINDVKLENVWRLTWLSTMKVLSVSHTQHAVQCTCTGCHRKMELYCHFPSVKSIFA